MIFSGLNGAVSKLKSDSKNLIESKLHANGWRLDLFSTFLSRKHSYHCMVGKRRWVKLKRKKAPIYPLPANFAKTVRQICEEGECL